MVQGISSASTGSLRLRFGLAGLVLLAEYLVVSFFFDAYNVSKRGGVWSVLGQVGSVGPLLVVFATAFLILPRLQTGAATKLLGRPSWVLLGVHALAFGGFLLITRGAFGGDEAPAGPAILWMISWAAVAAACASTLLVGVLGDWRLVVRGLWQAIAAGGLLGLVGWLAGSLSTQLWAPLSYATFVTVAKILELLSFDLLVDPVNVVLQLDGFAIAVAPVCSGFEGIGLLVALLTGFLIHQRQSLRFPRALVLLPVGIGLVWLGNAVRIAALMVLGARVDPELALGSFHSKAGWVFFCAIALALVAFTKRSRFFSRGGASEVEEVDNPTAALLMPLLVWIGLGLTTSMFSEGHDPWYAVRVVGAAGALWIYRSHYQQWLVRPSLSAWVVGLLVGVVWLLPLPFIEPLGEAVVPDFGGSKPLLGGWIVTRVLGAVLIVPLCEELGFRAYLARWLTRRAFWEVPFSALSPLAIVASSLVFGFVHERWLLAALTGVVYALLLRRTGKVIDAMAAHGASNAVIAAWVLSTGSWQHW